MARSVARTATSLAAIFDIEPSPRSNGDPLGGHPGRPPGQQPRRVDLGGDLGQRKSDALVVDDRRRRTPPAGWRRWWRIPVPPARCRSPARRPSVESARRCPMWLSRNAFRPRPPRAPWRVCARACPARPAGWPSGIRTPLNFSSAVCEARQPSLSSLRTSSRPGVPPGTMNNAWPRWPSSSSTTALTT